MKIHKLKEQARRFEQREEWERALQVYVQVLRGDVAEADFPLYNRAGDLHLRMGRPARAVDFYLQAADRYSEVGLYNNAIALCNKALRYFPERPDIYMRLAECSAAQGFAIEARRWVAEYAERMLQSQGVDEATRALNDVADKLNDPEVRALLGRRLASRGRAKPAIKQLRLAYIAWLEAGRLSDAETLRNEILEIDAEIELPPLPEREDADDDDEPEDQGQTDDEPEDQSQTDDESEDRDPSDDDVVAGQREDSTPAAEPEAPAAAAEEPRDTEPASAAAAEEPRDTEPEAPAAAAEEPRAPAARQKRQPAPEPPRAEEASEPGESDDAPELLDGFEYGEPPPPDDAEWEPEAVVEGPERPPHAKAARGPELARDTPERQPSAEAVDELDVAGEQSHEHEAPRAQTAPQEAGGDPDLGIDPYLGIKLHSIDSLEFPDLGDVDFDNALAAGLVDPANGSMEDRDVKEQADEPDPLLPLMDFGDADLVWDPVAAVTSSMDIDAVIAQSAALVEDGNPGGAAGVLGRLADKLVRSERYEDAARVVEHLTALRPDDLQLHQRWVGLAAHTADLQLLIQAYISLARCLSVRGATSKAAVVYRRVLDLDPTNEIARDEVAAAATKGSTTEQPPPSPPDAAPDPHSPAPTGQAPDDSPRTASDSSPHPDDEREFALMLAEFKERVNQELGEGDWASRYDLGIAFREMGLLDDAIAEFQASLRGATQHAKIYEQLGQCFMAKGQHTVAAQILARGARIATRAGDETLGLHYHLGRCYEALGRRAEAKEAFGHVVRANPRFADAEQRFARL